MCHRAVFSTGIALLNPFSALFMVNFTFCIHLYFILSFIVCRCSCDLEGLSISQSLNLKMGEAEEEEGGSVYTHVYSSSLKHSRSLFFSHKN